MGNINSNETSNDGLVDRLILLEYIKSKKIEYIFRAIDRGHYILSDDKNIIYKDLSWKMGYIHLSAPCVYSKVMEGLSLKSGLSFLNIGSGTGYLSTMAGLLLNSHGINHGIEINKDCIDFASKKLMELKNRCNALNQFDFCEPIFIHGNFCKVIPIRRYDRVYCGAECPESHEMFIKQFIKIGGVLIMPFKGNLLKIERINEDSWKHQVMLPVLFSPLIVPTDTATDLDQIQLPLSQPPPLQELSRLSVRKEIRKKLLTDHPYLVSRYMINSKKPSLIHQNKSAFFPLLDQASSHFHKITILPMHEGYLNEKVINNNTKDKYNNLIMKSQSPLLLYSIENRKNHVINSTTILAENIQKTVIDVDLFKFTDKNSTSFTKLPTSFVNKCSVADMQYLLACSKSTLYNISHTNIEINDDSKSKVRHSTNIIQDNENFSSKNINEWGIPCNYYYTAPQQQKSQLLEINYSTLSNEAEDIHPNQIYYAHKINNALLSDYMKQKTLQLPLPMELRLFINSNDHNHNHHL